MRIGNFNNWADDDIVKFIKIWQSSTSCWEAVGVLNNHDGTKWVLGETAEEEPIPWTKKKAAAARRWLNDTFRRKGMDIRMQELPDHRQRDWENIAYKILFKGE